MRPTSGRSDVDPSFGQMLGAAGRLAALVRAAPSARDEADALELARLAGISDVTPEALDQIERSVDDLASAYATTPPGDLLPLLRRQLAQVGRMLEIRSTLDQRRRLLVAGGWLATLRATVHIDLRHRAAADIHLSTAVQMARHAAAASSPRGRSCAEH